MNKLNIAFFTESGTKRGMGHLVRCYTIATEFKSRGCNVEFFLDSDMKYTEKFNDISYFKWDNFKLKNKYDIIFIDSYEANIDIYNTVSKFCKVPVYIDDFKRLDYPKGTIINFAPNANEVLYKQKEEKYNYLLGLIYIPIRNEFIDIKIDKKEQLFIMLGGNDIANLSLELATILKDLPIKKVIVSNNEKTIENLKKYNNIEVLYKPSDSKLIKAMASSSIAISTASMSVYELAYLKIPTIIIAVAKNQEDGVLQFIKYDIASESISIKKDSWKDELMNKVKYLLTNKNHPTNNTIDGIGTKRIVNNIFELIK